jgi:hypothetical protein
VKLESGNWSAEWNDDLDDGLGGALEYSLNVWHWSRLAGGLESDFYEGYHAVNTNYFTQMEIYQIQPDRTVPLEQVSSVDTTWPLNNTNYNMTNVVLTSAYGAFEWLNEVPQEEGALSYHPNPYTGFTEHGSANLERFSGGRLPNGDESLYVLDGTVTEKIVLPNGLIVYSNVPPQQVTVDMLGNLDASGEAKKMLPTQTKRASNLTADVPRSTDNVTTAPRYKARITCTGYGDVTGKTVNAIVGQKISLTCQLLDANSNPAPSIYAITNYQWTVPGYAISNFYVSPDSGTSNGIVCMAFPTTNNEADYYWVDGGNKQVQCSVQAGGQTLQAQTAFTILKPSADLLAFTNGSVVSVDANYFYISGTALHFGTDAKLVGQTNWGIRFYATNIVLNGCPSSSTFKFVQLGTLQAEHNLTNGKSSQYLGSGVDLHFPADYFAATETFWPMDDTPGEPVDGSAQVWRSDQFTMYLFYQVNLADSIPVPLKKLDWSWSGVAQTNSVGGWQLLSASVSVKNVNVPTGYPTWTNNLNNGSTITNDHWISPFP